MAKKPSGSNVDDHTRSYDHKEHEALMRPVVGLEAQFKQRRPPATYRYDRSLDPQLSWDVSADREAVERLIEQVRTATSLEQARSAAEQLKRLSSPFLNWAGKAERAELAVPTLPLFVHERLSTKAILESVRLRKRQLDLFGDTQLGIADRALRAYEHKTGWVNRLILGDSLHVLNSLLEYEGLGGQVQMIYVDPPYGVKFGSNFQPFVRKRDVRHGADDDLTREPEMVQAYRDTWELGLHSYLTYLRDRFRLARELLHPTGSLFVQISDENVHHVREVLDEVFGAENFAAMITVKKTTGAGSPAIGTEVLPATADFVLWYARAIEQIRYHQLYQARLGEGWVNYDYVRLPDGEHRRMTPPEREDWARLPTGARVYRRDNLTSTSSVGEASQPFEFGGRLYYPGPGGWKTSKEGRRRLLDAERLEAYGNTLSYRRFAADFPWSRLANIWDDTVTGGYAETRYYVVQTNTKVIQRCLLMTTDPGDLVLDPTCGSGTTAFVAEQWGRRWITVDTSRVPLALARQRLLTATFPYYELRDERAGVSGGFKYERRRNARGEEVGGIVPHITLESIAHGEPPKEEVLVDRPNVAPGTVRVSGPFVVEATIPAPIELEAPSEAPSTTGQDAAPPADGGRPVASPADYHARMLEVLRRSPLLHLPGNRTVAFKGIRAPARALSLHAEATSEANGEKPVAFVFGPESGAVTEQMVMSALREAYAKSYSHLYVVGFACEDAARRLIANGEAWGAPATFVNATMDVVMGDLLKTSRASQVFSVAGEPDVRLVRLKRQSDDGEPLYQVELRGLDVFDPATMEVDHRRGDDVPAWFLDTDYDELSFLVGQAFFPRTAAWDNLRRSLKGLYDDAVWDHLAGAVSEPFLGGECRRIAVKVIDDRGNELMVVKGLGEAEPEQR